jgi:tol-pal system protein YbgF
MMMPSDAAARTPRGGGSGGVARAAASPRVWKPAALALTALALGLTGCATKKDVRLLSEQLTAVQARQDSLYMELRLQNRALVDSMRSNSELVMRVQGNLGQQLVQVQQQVVQVQEHVGQSHAELARIQAQIEQNTRSVQHDPGAAADDSDVNELLQDGIQMLSRGNTGTARRAFETVLAEYPRHPLAADAQYYLADSFLRDQPPQPQRAAQEMEKVFQQYPDSPRAPEALFRACVIAQERGELARSRELCQRVIDGYPTSEAAMQARARLGRD